jgi:hypothetical protein
VGNRLSIGRSLNLHASGDAMLKGDLSQVQTPAGTWKLALPTASWLLGGTTIVSAV